MEFSDSHSHWIPAPTWVRFLLDFGHNWPTNVARPRRIALITMPCDSAGAALVSLGAMAQSLRNPEANDLRGHLDALVRHARQYLEYCRVCGMRCQPKVSRCGYASEVSGRFRFKGKDLYKVSNRSKLNKEEIWLFGKGVDRRLLPGFATDWQIDGAPLPQALDEAGALPEKIYGALLEGSAIDPNNLCSSFSGLCLAGRSSGKAASRDAYSTIRFRFDGEECDLASLLTIQEWTPLSISRMTFFNPITQKTDRFPYTPALVVADGDVAFLRVLDKPEFQGSDVVGVIHRVVERGALESIGNRVGSLSQWYSEDSELMNQLSPVPKGISSIVLRRHE